jgi:MoaA/NifB/PqqE/SkfB family radical SAM enzyme
MDDGTIRRFDRSIRSLFREALRQGWRDPRFAVFLLRVLRDQRRAVRRRRKWKDRGLHVPAFMIYSVTHRCNLRCAGCYARGHERPREPELDPRGLRRVIEQAGDLGVSVILLAGGEPLARPDLLGITREFPRIVFPLFTNGLLIDPTTVAAFKRQRHVIPVISLEGSRRETDGRRGSGVFERVHDAIGWLERERVFFGTSITLTRENFDLVTGDAFVRDLVAAGCRLFFFIDYVPVEGGTETLVLTPQHRDREKGRIASLRERFDALFVAFPGGEEEFGGCLAAGRGFAHVSPEGRLEPCPFSPFSDVSLRDTPLADALRSPLLRTIRENADRLDESAGGCALWENRDWVASLLSSK